MGINTNAMFKLGVLCLGFLFCNVCLGGDPEHKNPPKELVQYVRDATNLGLKDADIEQNAIKAGWPIGAIRDSIAYVHTTKKQPEDTHPTPPPVADPPKPAAAEKVTAPKPAARVEERLPSKSSADAEPPSATSGTGDEYHI